jgi:prophage regulatory protein
MKLLSREDLRARGIRWSRQHLDRMVKAGEFPRPLKLGAGTCAWLEPEINAWIEARAAERTMITPSISTVKGNRRETARAT